MRATELIERELETERAFELCVQVEEHFEFLDAMYGRRHRRNPRNYYRVLRRLELRRREAGVADRRETISAAFWALVPPEDR